MLRRKEVASNREDYLRWYKVHGYYAGSLHYSETAGFATISLPQLVHLFLNWNQQQTLRNNSWRKSNQKNWFSQNQIIQLLYAVFYFLHGWTFATMFLCCPFILDIQINFQKRYRFKKFKYCRHFNGWWSWSREKKIKWFQKYLIKNLKIIRRYLKIFDCNFYTFRRLNYRFISKQSKR